jgi:3-dehydroquinate synthase
MSAAEPTRIRVTAEQPYDVVIGPGVVSALPRLLGSSVRRVAVISPQGPHARGHLIRDDLAAIGYAADLIEVPDAEAAKTVEVAAHCWETLSTLELTRTDAIVGVGGGATTDVAGFVAATFLRGLRLVQVPTTLLGMVDAAVGGKTGINLPAGKNLVGAFYEPAGVLCDLDSLASLDRRDVASGLAEVVKCGFIADPEILRIVETDTQAALDTASGQMRELIERAVRVKASAVTGDLQETTSRRRDVGREALNYGHTMGHAVERVEGYTLRHGEAVAIGLVYVAELARLAGRLDAETASRHRRVLASLGLPTSYAGASWPDLQAAMRVDKKALGDRLRFVILETVGRPAILSGPPDALLASAFAQIAA